MISMKKIAGPALSFVLAATASTAALAQATTSTGATATIVGSHVGNVNTTFVNGVNASGTAIGTTSQAVSSDTYVANNNSLTPAAINYAATIYEYNSTAQSLSAVGVQAADLTGTAVGVQSGTNGQKTVDITKNIIGPSGSVTGLANIQVESSQNTGTIDTTAVQQVAAAFSGLGHSALAVTNNGYVANNNSIGSVPTASSGDIVVSNSVAATISGFNAQSSVLTGTAGGVDAGSRSTTTVNITANLLKPTT